MIRKKFPERFIKRFGELLGDELDIFLGYTLKPLKPVIRTNILKTTPNELKKRLNWGLKEIPFCKGSFWLEKPPKSIGNSIEFLLGYFHTQEASSLVPVIALNPKENEIILDMCAAPGSKTTQIASEMKNSGLIIANDIRINRIKSLASNLERCGVINSIITRNDGTRFWKQGEVFDRVLVDAPCSGEGFIRKDWKGLKYWGLGMIQSSSRIQKKLLLSGFDCLKPGGILVYSTCTLAPEENEENIDFLLKRRNAKIEKVNIKNLKSRKGLIKWRNARYNPEVKKCLRIYPQDNDTEGFFIAEIRK